MSTIEQLAAILRDEGWSPAWHSLVPIQTAGSRPPFFCIHGLGGNVLLFYDLARNLGSDQPFFGLQAQGLDGKHPCHNRVEDMAAFYISEMRRVQPEGPYFLGGYSFGGLVALETAQQLTAQGQEVGLLVLLDTLLIHQVQSPETQASGGESAGLFRSIWSAAQGIFQVPAEQRRLYLSEIAKRRREKIRRRLRLLTLPPDSKRALTEVAWACSKAQAAYVPRVYPGRTILFRSRDRRLTEFRNPHTGWSAYFAGGLEICEILGDHYNILVEPQVRLVAEQLRGILNGKHPATQGRELT
jgi:thioesterase domain-containing protein